MEKDIVVVGRNLNVDGYIVETKPFSASVGDAIMIGTGEILPVRLVFRNADFAEEAALREMFHEVTPKCYYFEARDVFGAAENA